jgi:hypothetical protein
MAGFLPFLRRIFSHTGNPAPYKTAEVYNDLRSHILRLTPAELGIDTNHKVLAVLMETGYAEGAATLVAVLDGSASLYLSGGGGIIGAGENPGPSAAARKMVAIAADFASACTKTSEFPLPQNEHTRFYIVTPEGVLTSEAKHDDLGNRRCQLWPLFYAGHELITLMRLADTEFTRSR